MIRVHTIFAAKCVTAPPVPHVSHVVQKAFELATYSVLAKHVGAQAGNW